MLPAESNTACSCLATQNQSLYSNRRKIIGCKVKHNRLIYNDFYVVFVGSVEGLYVVFGYTF